MDAKLKALKVADLKEILVKASAPALGRVNKPDLINKILANPAAVKVYEELYLPSNPTSKPGAPSPPKPAPPTSNNDDLLAPPEDLDWSIMDAGDVAPVTASPAKNPVPAHQSPLTKPAQENNHAAPPKAPAVPASSTKISPLPSSNSKADNPATVDDELEKRKARAARFGIPLVEPTRPPQHQARQVSQTKQAGQLPDDPERLRKRAERFGVSNTPVQPTKAGSKRAAPAEEVDAEELERRRKRAERFGTKV
ncbi:hypothetical protein EV401DRAFT_2240881 [Pisolithus croceorrhizus]|nr:hypothetical protein EV401DRAFT_2240881 [Pisolithus croceorrhizus]